MSRIRRRRQRPERQALEEVPWHELAQLVHRGEVSAEDANAATHERAARGNGGCPPYADLELGRPDATHEAR